MSDEEWPIGTPREEVLARVVARGNRIVAVRRAFSVAMVASVVGVSALGAGAVISNLGSKGVETEQIAFGPRPPDAGSSPATSSTSATVGQTAGTTLALGPGSATATSPPTATTVSAPLATGRPAPSVPARSTTTRPPTTTSRPPTTTTSRPPTTTSTTTIAAPAVGTLRMKADGVPVGTSVCENEPASVVSVSIAEATHVVLNWNNGDKTHTLTMTPDGDEWSVQLGAIGASPDAPTLPVLVTVVASGPGGVTRTSAALEVVDCTP